MEFIESSDLAGFLSGTDRSTLMFILFDNPSKAYYAGQNVTGQLIVRVKKVKKLRKITLTFKGEAYVELKETEFETDKDGRSKTVTNEYTGNEKYFEDSILVAGGSAGEMELKPGQYCYHFNFPLPQNIPSSFEGSFLGGCGYIRYTVKGEMVRPWRFNHRCKTAFTVVSPLDLNLISKVKEPVLEQRSKTFWTLCCKSGLLDLSVELPCSGYVPGQVISPKIDIENGSNVLVQPVKCILRQQIKWTATWPLTKTRHESEDIAKVTINDLVEPHSSKTLICPEMKIPSVPPSSFDQHCKIIDIGYYLEVEAVAGTFHINLRARIPIIMGTVPLLTGPTRFVPSAPALEPNAPEKSEVEPAPSEPLPTGFAPDTPNTPSAPPAYADLPPPSYEECMFGATNIKVGEDDEHTMGPTEFTPRYPVWNFNQQTVASPGLHQIKGAS